MTTTKRIGYKGPSRAKRFPKFVVVVAQVSGIYFDMTYNINIDQEFAIVNNLSLVQVSTLAAFMTLPVWANNIAIDGAVWYQYSDEKMAEDFPLLFGIAKRCYKNIAELADLGFVELTKLGRIKYVRFTSRCADWNKQKEQIRSNSPKTDQEKTENGLTISPKTDPHKDYNITDSNIKDIPAGGGLFQDQPEFQPVTVTRPRRTSEQLCLFANSKFNELSIFMEEFKGPEFEGIDIVYYYHAVADWSAQKGKKMRDWIATTRNFIRSDIEKKKLHKLSTGDNALSQEAQEYLREMSLGL